MEHDSHNLNSEVGDFENNVVLLPDEFYAKRDLRIGLAMLDLEVQTLSDSVPGVMVDVVDSFKDFVEMIPGMRGINKMLDDPERTKFLLTTNKSRFLPIFVKEKHILVDARLHGVSLLDDTKSPALQEFAAWDTAKLIVPLGDVIRRKQTLDEIGVEEGESGRLSGYWSLASATSLILAETAYSLTQDKRDLEGECTDYFQRLAFSLPVFGPGTKLAQSQFESTITRAIAESVARKLIVSKLVGGLALNRNIAVDALQDELSIMQVRKLIDRTRLTDNVVSIEEIAAAKPFEDEDIERFLGKDI